MNLHVDFYFSFKLTRVTQMFCSDGPTSIPIPVISDVTMYYLFT